MSIDLFSFAFPFRSLKNLVLSAVAVFGLAACDENGEFNLDGAFAAKPENAAEAGAASEGEFVEKDVESPDVFSANETGLWDGRPSLGGVWVAHPDVKDPERVIIRNTENGKFVVGALFRRERDIPGPRLQLSSDAASAIGVLAGAPVELSVVALRKERIEIAPPEPEVAEEPAKVEEPAEVENEVPAPAAIEETELDPIEAAEAAIEEAEPTPVIVKPVEPPKESEPTVESSLPKNTLDKPYVQVGTYSVERNANAVADQMRNAGMVPTVKSGDNDGKAFWRVVVGPATSTADQEELLKKIKAEGYSDAYTVTN